MRRNEKFAVSYHQVSRRAAPRFSVRAGTPGTCLRLLRSSVLLRWLNNY